MENIHPSHLIPMNSFRGTYPLEIDLVYANPDHEDNHFGGLYHKDANLLFAHKDIVPVVLLASLICQHTNGWVLELKDCYRPVEAQKKMEEYGYDPALVSLPGAGAHPRGMAIDIVPIIVIPGARYVTTGIDMGTLFDHFADDLKNNPADRDCLKFEKMGRVDQLSRALDIVKNRATLEAAMKMAAGAFGQRIVPLQEEWWDFRFEKGDIADKREPGVTYWGDYEPISEKEMPPYMHVVGEPSQPPSRVMSAWWRAAEMIHVRVQKKAIELGLKRRALFAAAQP